MRGEEYKPLWLRRNIVKYNTLHKNDKPDPKLINAEPPLRRATVHNYKNPTTKQAFVPIDKFVDFVDVSTLNDYDYVIADPESTSVPDPVTSTKEKTDDTRSTGVSNQQSSPPASTSVLDTGPADTVFEIKPKTSMAQVSKASTSPPLVNPFGNPFESEIFFDTADGLVEY